MNFIAQKKVGIIVQIGADTTGLKQEIGESGKAISKLSKNSASSRKLLKSNPQDDAAQLQHQKNLQAQIVATTQKLDLQNKQLKEMNKRLQIGDMSQDEFDKFQRSINSTSTSLNRLEKELKDVDKGSQKSGKSFFDMSKMLKSGSAMATKAIDVLVKSVKALVSAVVDAIKSSFQFTRQLESMSIMLGLTANEMLGLARAGLAVDVQMAALGQSMVRLNIFAGQAMMGGSSRQVEIFEDLGVALLDANGKARNSIDVFTDLFSVLNDRDLSEAQTALYRLFGGRNAAEMSKFLELTDEQLKDLNKEIKENDEISEETIDSMNEFTNSVKQLGLDVKLLIVSLSEALLPILEALAKLIELIVIPIIEAITYVFERWGDELALIFKWIGAVAYLIVAVFMRALKNVFRILNPIVQLFGWWWEILDGIYSSLVKIINILPFFDLPTVDEEMSSGGNSSPEQTPQNLNGAETFGTNNITINVNETANARSTGREVVRQFDKHLGGLKR